MGFYGHKPISYSLSIFLIVFKQPAQVEQQCNHLSCRCPTQASTGKTPHSDGFDGVDKTNSSLSCSIVFCGLGFRDSHKLIQSIVALLSSHVNWVSKNHYYYLTCKLLSLLLLWVNWITEAHCQYLSCMKLIGMEQRSQKYSIQDRPMDIKIVNIFSQDTPDYFLLFNGS